MLAHRMFIDGTDVQDELAYARALASTYEITHTTMHSVHNISIADLVNTAYAVYHIHTNQQNQFK